MRVELDAKYVPLGSYYRTSGHQGSRAPLRVSPHKHCAGCVLNHVDCKSTVPLFQDWDCPQPSFFPPSLFSLILSALDLSQCSLSQTSSSKALLLNPRNTGAEPCSCCVLSPCTSWCLEIAGWILWMWWFCSGTCHLTGLWILTVISSVVSVHTYRLSR